MNNNRNQNNNRRRGRGNRNQGGGGSQGNRIDSRARGNAPQLLDKYKKLAEDAHRNGDRVQAEYYLQFADHYFRVIADNRSRQDEPRGDQRMDTRGGRRDEREPDEFESEFDSESDDRRRFEPRDRDSREGQGPGQGSGQGRGQGRERDGRDDNRERPRREFRRAEQFDEEAGVSEGNEGSAFEPEDNPFIREASEPREERPKRRAARPRRTGTEDAAIDAAALPPAFSANDAGEAEAAPAPRARRKRSDGGTLSAVG